MKKTLSTIDDIRRHFAENNVPYYFISASNFNLMGLHDWVMSWQNINLVNCFDHQHPQVLMVADDHSRIFESIEDINVYLLKSDEVNAILSKYSGESGTRGCALFLFFDERIEALCQDMNLAVILPKSSLVREIDSKIVTTEIGNQAGVRSVQNVLTKISSFANLQEMAQQANLGKRWVVQTPYGDSGKTTFFIANEDDYQAVSEQIEREDLVKVMRWVNCTGTAIEACATRWGTFVGSLLTELIGIDELTPYPGGWCGNELYDTAFSMEIRQQVLHSTQAMGNALYQRGYRGYFELDYLIDLDTNEVYLGELNARLTGISAMTNMSNFSSANIPLFLFHLLEYQDDVDLKLNVDEFNQSVLASGADGTAAQVILKYTDTSLKIITQAPASGVYTMGADGNLSLQRSGYNRRDAVAENEVYVMRIMAAGEYAYKGGDLAIMFLNRVIRDTKGKLNPDGGEWVAALQRCFLFRPLSQEERYAVDLARNPVNVKSGRTQ